jgi:hypothetical protein
MKKLVLIMMALMLVSLSACSNTSRVNNSPVRQSNNNNEVEDCDADDLLEGDEDCYGVDLKKKKHKSSHSVIAKPTSPKTNLKSKIKSKVIKPKTKTIKISKPKKVKISRVKPKKSSSYTIKKSSPSRSYSKSTRSSGKRR